MCTRETFWHRLWFIVIMVRWTHFYRTIHSYTLNHGCSYFLFFRAAISIRPLSKTRQKKTQSETKILCSPAVPGFKVKNWMKVVFFFVIHLHLGVKSFYTYVTIQSSLLQTATGLCLVCNSKRNNRTIEYQLKLLLKLFKRISIDILLFTVSQVNSKFPAHSLLAPLPLQF